jgi:hypothetical protein
MFAIDCCNSLAGRFQLVDIHFRFAMPLRHERCESIRRTFAAVYVRHCLRDNRRLNVASL